MEALSFAIAALACDFSNALRRGRLALLLLRQTHTVVVGESRFRHIPNSFTVASPDSPESSHVEALMFVVTAHSQETGNL